MYDYGQPILALHGGESPSRSAIIYCRPDNCAPAASTSTQHEADNYLNTRWKRTAKFLRELTRRKAAMAEEIRRERSACQIIPAAERCALLASTPVFQSYNSAPQPVPSSWSLQPNGPVVSSISMPYPATSVGQPNSLSYSGSQLIKNNSAAKRTSGTGVTSTLDMLLQTVIQRSTAVSTKLVRKCALTHEGGEGRQDEIRESCDGSAATSVPPLRPSVMGVIPAPSLSAEASTASNNAGRSSQQGMLPRDRKPEAHDNADGPARPLTSRRRQQQQQQPLPGSTTSDSSALGQQQGTAPATCEATQPPGNQPPDPYSHPSHAEPRPYGRWLADSGHGLHGTNLPYRKASAGHSPPAAPAPYVFRSVDGGVGRLQRRLGGGPLRPGTCLEPKTEAGGGGAHATRRTNSGGGDVHLPPLGMRRARTASLVGTYEYRTNGGGSGKSTISAHSSSGDSSPEGSSQGTPRPATEPRCHTASNGRLMSHSAAHRRASANPAASQSSWAKSTTPRELMFTQF